MLSYYFSFYLADQIFRYSIEKLVNYHSIEEYLENEENLTISPDEQVPFHRLLAGYYILQGRFEKLDSLLEKHSPSFKASGFSGTLAFLLGKSDQAFDYYEKDLVQLNEFFGDQKGFFFGLPGLFCVLALLDRNKDGDRSTIKQNISA